MHAAVSDRDARPPHPSREAPGFGPPPYPHDAKWLAGPPGRPRVPESSRVPETAKWTILRPRQQRPVASSDHVAAVRVRVPPAGAEPYPPGGPRVRAGVLRRAVRGGAARGARLRVIRRSSYSRGSPPLRAGAWRGGATGSARRRGHTPALRARRTSRVRPAAAAAASERSSSFPNDPYGGYDAVNYPSSGARRARARGRVFLRAVARLRRSAVVRRGACG